MKRRRYAGFLLLLPAIVWACGDDDTNAVVTPTIDAGSTSGSSASSSSGTSGTSSSSSSSSGSLDSGTHSGHDSGADAGDAGRTCTPTSATTKIQPINLGILLDQSSSMNDSLGGGNTRWKATTAAVQSYAAATTTAVNAALTFFDATDACAVASYTTPSVAFGALPGKAADLKTAMDGHSPSTNTTTQPALVGVLQSTKAQATAHPEQATAVVLLTDGEPSTACAGGMNTVDGVKAAAAAGLPIPTYVIDLADNANVRSFATAGGTTAFTAANQAQIQAALTSIQDDLKCQLPLPKPPAGTFDPTKVSVTIPSSATPLPYGACSGVAPGWHLDSTSAPTRLILCPASCTALGAGDATVKFTCP